MADKTYSQLLKDPRWQRKRLEILERDEWTCRSCAGMEDTLHVHHRRYIWGRMPWEYENELLITLCEGCHQAITDGLERLKVAIASLHVQDINRVFAYVIGINASYDALTGTAINNSVLPAEVHSDAMAAQGLGEALGLSRKDLTRLYKTTGLTVASVISEANKAKRIV